MSEKYPDNLSSEANTSFILQNISLTYIYQQSLTSKEINQEKCNQKGFENATQNIGVLFVCTQLAIYPFSIYPFGAKRPAIHFYYADV